MDYNLARTYNSRGVGVLWEGIVKPIIDSIKEKETKNQKKLEKKTEIIKRFKNTKLTLEDREYLDSVYAAIRQAKETADELYELLKSYRKKKIAGNSIPLVIGNCIRRINIAYLRVNKQHNPELEIFSTEVTRMLNICKDFVELAKDYVRIYATFSPEFEANVLESLYTSINKLWDDINETVRTINQINNR